jgi:dihydroxyacetone kinase
VNGRVEPQAVVVPGGGLLRLVEAEARLARALAEVEEEAAALVRAAREEAAQRAARIEEEIEADAAALGMGIAAERDAEMSRIAAAADQRCRLLGGLSAEAVDRLAAELEARLLPLDAAEQPS